MKPELKPYNKTLGPLQIVHDFKFVAMNLSDDYGILDSLPASEKLAHIKARIDRLARLGYGGVVMNVDYNNYLTDPKAFRLFGEAVEYAREKNLRVWLYDEQYYPSGSAGGLTLAGHPEYESICLSCVSDTYTVDSAPIRVPSPHGHGPLAFAVAMPLTDGKPKYEARIDVSAFRDPAGGLCWDTPNGCWKVWCFFVRALYEHTYLPHALRAPRRYISIYNKNAVEHFMNITFRDGYENYMPGPLGDSIEAVFTDEPSSFPYAPNDKAPSPFRSVSILDRPLPDIPGLPYIPWGTDVQAAYKEAYGEELALSLPALFEEFEDSRVLRLRFYELLNRLAKEAFPAYLQQQLGGMGMMLSGHYWAEEQFDIHPVCFGDILEHLGCFDIPGCDCLWSTAKKLQHSTACRLAASAAHLSGRKKVMIEASNMLDANQKVTLDYLRAAISMMFVHGINTVTSYYGEKMLADAEMEAFCRHIAALSSLLDGATFQVDTLLYYPFEQLCEDMPPQAAPYPTAYKTDHFRINETCEYLQKHQVFFDFINKRHLLSCRIESGTLLTAYGQRIRHIVFPAISHADPELAQFLQKAANAGVEVFFFGEPRGIEGLAFTPKFITAEQHPRSDLQLATFSDSLTAAHYAQENYTLYMLMNTGASETFRFSVSCREGQKPYLVELDTFSLWELPGEIRNGRANISLHIAQNRCAILCIG